MKSVVLAGFVALIGTAAASLSAAAEAANDLLECRTPDGVFTLEQSDFEAMSGGFKNPDGTWASSADQVRAAWLARMQKHDVSSKLYAAVCETRMLARMLMTHKPREPVVADIQPNGPYGDYQIAYFRDEEIPALDALIKSEYARH